MILVDIVAMGRIGFALCRDGLLPAWSVRSARSSTPRCASPSARRSLRLLGAFVPLTTLAEMVSIGTCSRSSSSRSRSRAAQDQAEARAALPDAAGAAAPDRPALSCLALMSSLAVETWLRFLVWLVLGLVVYFGYGRPHSRLARQRLRCEGPPTRCERPSVSL